MNCALRGDLGPACNSAGMIDRYVLGIHHLYTKPVYRNLKVSVNRFFDLVMFTIVVHFDQP